MHRRAASTPSRRLFGSAISPRQSPAGTRSSRGRRTGCRVRDGHGPESRLIPICAQHALASLAPPPRQERSRDPVAAPPVDPLEQHGELVNTLKRDYMRVTPLPNAKAVLDLVGGWIEDYNDNHPHSGLKMRSPREFIATRTAIARASGKTGARSPTISTGRNRAWSSAASSAAKRGPRNQLKTRSSIHVVPPRHLGSPTGPAAASVRRSTASRRRFRASASGAPPCPNLYDRA